MTQPFDLPPRVTATHITVAPPGTNLGQFLGPHTITPPLVTTEVLKAMRDVGPVEMTITDIDWQTAALLMGRSVLELLGTPQNRDARRRATLTPRTKGRHL